jgi:hypothetical protein
MPKFINKPPVTLPRQSSQTNREMMQHEQTKDEDYAQEKGTTTDHMKD